MKIKRIEAEYFGKFKTWNSPEFTKNLVVIYGPNESGKSTVFNLLSTLIYGWSPASKEDNPFVPWDRGIASCKGYFTDKNNGEFTVVRRLRSKAEGILEAEGESLIIGNNQLPHVGILPRELFSDVYSLTIDELRFPDEKLWQEMQDHLLGGQFASIIRPVRNVIEQLDSESNGLWRPDRRGSPREKQLKANLAELKRKLIETEDRQKELHVFIQEQQDLVKMLNNKLDRKAELTSIIDRSERLLPIRNKLKYIEELELKAGDISEFDKLPEDVKKQLIDFNEKIVSDDQKLKSEKMQEEKILNQARLYSSKDTAIIEKENEIKNAVISCSTIIGDIKAINDLDNEIKDYVSRLNERARDIINGGWDEKYVQALKKVDEPGLKALVGQYKTIKLQSDEQKVLITGLKGKGAGMHSYIIPVTAVMLLLIGVISLIGKSFSLQGVLSSVAGVLLFVYYLLFFRSSTNSELKSAGERLRKLDKKLKDVADSIKKCLGNIPVSEIFLESPDENLIMNIARMKDTMNYLEDLYKKQDRVEYRTESALKKIETLINISEPYSIETLQECINELQEMLSSARSHLDGYMNAQERLKEIRPAITEIEFEIENLESKRNTILDTINNAKGDSVDEKINDIDNRRTLMRKALALKEELQMNNPGLERIVDEIMAIENVGQAWLFDIDEVARYKTERDQIDVELNQINERIVSIKKDIEHMQQTQGPDDIKGEIEAIEDEIENIRIKRDRLSLLKNILIEADREYRDEHQPDIIKKSGKYLNIITGGRYSSMLMDENLNKLVVKDSSGYPVELDMCLSRGTREQIFFAFRMALMEHMDNGNEKIPVFLDETLVNWDDIRVGNFISILNSMVDGRQVFIFTCHDSTKQLFKDIPWAQIVELDV
jgi:hypothetical protein